MIPHLDCSNVEFADCVISGTNFSGADLSGAYFHGTTLVECDLRAANLEGAAFDGCVLKEVDLTGAKLTGTELTGVELERSTLADLSLDDVAWESVTLTGGVVRSLSGAGEWTGVVMRDAQVEDFDTSAMTLKRCLTNTSPAPEGFGALSGRRKRVR